MKVLDTVSAKKSNRFGADCVLVDADGTEFVVAAVVAFSEDDAVGSCWLEGEPVRASSREGRPRGRLGVSGGALGGGEGEGAQWVSEVTMESAEANLLRSEGGCPMIENCT